jgi:hypothetical protein
LRDEHILLTGGFDVWNSVLIPAYNNGRRKRALRCELDVSVENRERGSRGGAQPDDSDAGKQYQKGNKPDAGEEEDTGPASSAAS